MTGRQALLLVHGAWHGAWCWAPVIERLSAAGVQAVAVELPFTSFEADVAAVQDAIAGLGSDVVVCGHSYGGRLVSAATGSLPTVRHLVYLSVQLPNAQQLAEYSRQPRQTSTAVPDRPTVRARYYNECSEADVLAAARQLRPMTSVPGGTLGLDCRPWEKITSTYIVCTRDHAIDPAVQRLMARNTTYTAEVPADHSAFLSAPDALARVLASIVLTDRP
jgi:pimeloyl-ACP methyl ester carboxylesterase